MTIAKLALLVLALPIVAKADLIGTFKLVDVNVSGTGGSGYLTGSITYDAHSNITAESITFHNTTTNSTYLYNTHSPAASTDLSGAARKDEFTSNSVNVVSFAGQTASAPVRTYSDLYLTYTLASATPTSIKYSLSTDHSSAIDIFTIPTVPTSTSLSTFSQFFITGGYLSLATPAAPIPTAPTPEPATLLLLSTGIVGLAAATRRRFFQ